jgi:RNA-binding protein
MSVPNRGFNAAFVLVAAEPRCGTIRLLDMPLTARQRQFLRGLAHALSPIVRVGKGGVSDSVIAETKKSLAAHELIKVRFDAAEGTERHSQAESLAAAVNAQIAGLVGKVAILYRPRDEGPDIELPGLSSRP